MITSIASGKGGTGKATVIVCDKKLHHRLPLQLPLPYWVIPLRKLVPPCAHCGFPKPKFRKIIKKSLIEINKQTT
ncbi:MAG: hypothetical protein DNFNHJIP_00605 [Candidatus Argoarchaeum ethanivorans]|uniref:Uncharacterized protein n=1 Tax=Candidatus Argoarchaeum ethanivorans TaxID=2608793 RepID=A0A812A0X3_9EURY|nr:MAG: hypothetical protein DNFNHJIP_00605 [Candidatus Argoarchaeum ethanivorans]